MSSSLPSSPRILIAAEQPLEALALETMLHGAGHRDVRVTSDAREIAPLYAKWPFRLLILDMEMHSLPGLQVLASVAPFMREHGLVTLALTPPGDGSLVEQALRAGALDVINRPLRKDDVLLHVGWALRGLQDQPALNRRPS